MYNNINRFKRKSPYLRGNGIGIELMVGLLVPHNQRFREEERDKIRKRKEER